MYLMKKLLLLFILATNQLYSQDKTYDNFSVQDKKIIWQKIYPKDSITDLSKITALKFNSNTTASCYNQKLSCKGLAIYTESTFQFDLLVEEKENKVRITISNIFFDSNLQVTVGYITTSKKYVTLEEAELRTSDFKFRKNTQSQKNMNCLDNYLIDLFKPKQSNAW